MGQGIPCTVCNSMNCVSDAIFSFNGWRVKCDRCGSFDITEDAMEELARAANRHPGKRSHVSGFIRNRRESIKASGARQERLLIVTSRKNVENTTDCTGLDDILANYPLAPQDRLDALLTHLVWKSDNMPGTSIQLDMHRDMSLGYAEGDYAFRYLLDQLADDGLISVEFVNPSNVALLKVTVKGWNRAAELERGKLASKPLQGFVAMSFDPTTRAEWQPGLTAGITNAGYVPYIVDMAEYVGSITDQLIAEIRKSRFVVADLTGHRPNVYYEAGFADGLGIPVFYTCKQEEQKEVHFDKRQENIIFWKDTDDLATRLQNRIEATLGRPPVHLPGN